MKKLILSFVALLAVGTMAKAELISESTDLGADGAGIVVDASTGWGSGLSGVTFPISAGVTTTVSFTNDPFKRDEGQWSQFIVESIATEKGDGFTLRADLWAWTYILNNAANGEQSINAPTWEATCSWELTEDLDSDGTADWVPVFIQMCKDNTDLTVSASIDGSSVIYVITWYDTDGAEKETETYTTTYPLGVPDDLSFQVGADGGNVTLKSVDFTTTANYGSATIFADPVDNWWSQLAIGMEDLLGDIDPEDVLDIEFYADDEFIVAYNYPDVSSEDGKGWFQSQLVTEIVVDNVAFDEDLYYLALVSQKNDSEYHTINWTVHTANSAEENAVIYTSIKEVKLADVEVVEVARYNLAGQKIAGEQKGINIIKYSDGSSKKVLVK